MKILITRSAGFVGSALIIKMLELAHKVIGIDNHNDHYNARLKSTTNAN
jgi:UDP-glucuronate 4-epimerase